MCGKKCIKNIKYTNVALEHRASVGLRSTRSNITICQKSKKKSRKWETHTHSGKSTLTIYFSVSDSFFRRISKRCRRRVFEHIFLLSHSLFGIRLRFIPVLNIIILLSLLHVDPSENTKTNVLEVGDFTFDSEWNEKCIGFTITWVLFLLFYFFLKPLFWDCSKTFVPSYQPIGNLPLIVL